MIWNQPLNEAQLSGSINSFENKLKMRLGHAMLHSFSLVPQHQMASTFLGSIVSRFLSVIIIN